MILRIALIVIVLIGLTAWAIFRSGFGTTSSSSSNGGAAEAVEEAGGFSVVDDTPVISGSIPRPNSGVAPEDPGDRGGYLQLGLLAVLVGGIGFIGFRVVREGQRNLERQRQGSAYQ